MPLLKTMRICFNPVRAIDDWLKEAAAQTGVFPADFQPDTRAADPRFGDLQANGVLPLAKSLKQNPRALATTLVDALKADPRCDPALIEVSIAGPGFINFRFMPAFLDGWLERFHDSRTFGEGAGEMYRGRRIVIDYSSPNTAKQMHVGHLRSMIIGEAIQRLLRFCGASVVRDNHIGDWGTQFGILIMAIKRHGGQIPEGDDALERLEALYKEGSVLTKADPTALDEARRELVKLQQGDADNLALWQRINAVSEDAFNALYQLLGISFDLTLGESFYRDKVDRIYTEMEAAGLAVESEGALVVFHPEHPRFKAQPFIIRKQDGASNYASTDLATALYRVEELKAEEIIYVTDARQQDHFQQLFLTVEKWFTARGYALPALRHVWFGTILGEDGKAIKTRSGDPIKLKDLLAEAVQRAKTIVDAKNPELPEEERHAIAEAVGLGAVRYSDLSQNRTSDYVFSWDKLLSFDGNTAPYLLYAVARIHSIFRKAGCEPGSEETDAAPLETAEELALARKLLAFPLTLDLVISDLRPHQLCGYLYELAGEFSTFYNANKVLDDDPAIRRRRLRLCARTLRVMECGLDLLGITTLERM
jgi:arginyl-tRNA synthetase